VVGAEQAVVFDLHDTLVHLIPSTEQAMAAILDVSVKDYASAWCVIDERIEAGSWAPSSDDRWVDLYGDLVDMLGLPFGPEEVAARFGRLFRSVDSYAVFEDVPSVLAELRGSDLRIGVV
jgi:HAD superfamily hydrolase (TIGR01549 family)